MAPSVKSITSMYNTQHNDPQHKIKLTKSDYNTSSAPTFHHVMTSHVKICLNGKFLYQMINIYKPCWSCFSGCLEEFRYSSWGPSGIGWCYLYKEFHLYCHQNLQCSSYTHIIINWARPDCENSKICQFLFIPIFIKISWSHHQSMTSFCL